MNRQETIEDLRRLQRFRINLIKSRNRLANQLLANVAHSLYGPFASKEEFGVGFEKARDVIDGGECPGNLREMIDSLSASVKAFDKMLDRTEREMVKLCESGIDPLVIEWVNLPHQRGFGLLSLAVIIGEAGDLSNYATPGKLWKRFGLIPYAHKGEHFAASTLRSKGKKPDVGWEEAGYSPRRRSIAFNIGEALVKQNGNGPYRLHCAIKKADYYAKHRDDVTDNGKSTWKPCDKCTGPGADVFCMTCGGSGFKSARCNNHGKQLMTKLLIKNLWIVWTGSSGDGDAINAIEPGLAVAT